MADTPLIDLFASDLKPGPAEELSARNETYQPHPRGWHWIDLQPGQRSGRLVVVERAGSKPGGGQRLWVCRCDCGLLVHVAGSELKRGRVRSCGCLGQESRSKTHRRHGKAGTRIYWVWRAMIGRCENLADKRWHDYGGRGVKVCPEWHHFEAFYADMGDPPERTSLDRIDVDGDYCAANCRWATVAEQARNRRDNHVVEIAGERLCLVDWLVRLGVKRATYRTRIRRGWSDVDALTRPAAISNRMRLLDLPEDVQERIRKGELTAAHGVALARFKGYGAVQSALAKLTVERTYTSKQIEDRLPFAWELERAGAVKSLTYGWGRSEREACGKCPHFRSEGGGYCLDPACYDRKTAEAAAARSAELAAKVEEARAGGTELPTTRQLGQLHK